MKFDPTTIELGKALSPVRRILAYLAILLVYFFYCYNFSLLSIMGPILTGDYGFTQTQFSFLFSLQSWGLILGTLISGVACMKIGKKRTLMALGFIFATSTLVHIVAVSSYPMWVIFRLLAGCALGGTYGTCVGLIVDLFPSEIRGRLTAIASSLFALAGVLAGAIAAQWFGTNWSIVVWAGIIPVYVGIVLIFFLVPDDLELTKQRELAALQSNNEKVSYRSLMQGKYAALAIMCIVMSGMNFSGYSGFSQFVPIYLQKDIGMASAQWGSLVSIQSVGQFIGFLFFGFIGDMIGRKKTMVGMLLCGVMIPVYMSLGLEQYSLFMVAAFLFGLGLGYSGIWGTYYTELFPERFRFIAAGFCFNMGRIISTFVVLGLGMVTDAGVSRKMALTIPMIFFFIGTVLWCFLPETLSKKKASE